MADASTPSQQLESGLACSQTCGSDHVVYTNPNQNWCSTAWLITRDPPLKPKSCQQLLCRSQAIHFAKSLPSIALTVHILALLQTRAQQPKTSTIRPRCIPSPLSILTRPLARRLSSRNQSQKSTLPYISMISNQGQGSHNRSMPHGALNKAQSGRQINRRDRSAARRTEVTACLEI